MELLTVEGEEPVLVYQNLNSANWGMAIYGETIVTVMENGQLEAWQLFTGLKLHTFRGHRGFGTGLSISPDGTRILSVSEDQSMYLWDLTSILEHRQWTSLPESTIAGQAVLGADKRHLLVGSWNGTSTIWDIETQESLVTTSFFDGRIRSVAYAPNLETVLNGFDKGVANLYDAETGELLLEIAAGEGTDIILGLAYLPDSSQAISTSQAGLVRRWDLATGEMLAEYIGHEGAVTSVVMLEDGQRMLTTSGDSSIILWDIESGEIMQRYLGHRRTVNAVVVSPDGTQILSGSEDSRLLLWDLETGQELREYLGHTGSVTVLSFSPDGLNAVSGTNTGSVGIWDIQTGEMLRRVDARNWVVGLSYLPENEEFVSVAGNGQIEIWKAYIPLDEFLDWVGANRHLRDLSCEEKLQYQLPTDCEPE
jgi:WD40 repeat protein